METQAEDKVSSQQPNLDKILEKINEIARKSADGNYIYRGESECYDKVSSSLYRESPAMNRTKIGIAYTQQAILEEAKTYIGQTDDIDKTDRIEILTELQHFGGKTNLIDFTKDYLIALFFACDGSHDKEGRVILLKSKSENYKTRKPRRTNNRVQSQKSVFVESPTGFVEPENLVTIPADLKFPILAYLEKHHRISIATIYNDLHGFIRRSASIDFLKGFTNHGKVDEAKTREEEDEYYENAVRHYTEAVKLKPDFAVAYYNRGVAYSNTGNFEAAIEDYSKAIALNPEDEDAEAYYNRGVAYRGKGNFDAAIADFNKAIDLDPENAVVYFHRGKAWLRLKEWQKAKADLTTAKKMACDIVESFHNDYESVEAFETENGAKIPEDIAALLQRK